MNILIADDTAPAAHAFEAAIRKLGHKPLVCTTLAEATSIINNPNSSIEIAFLDNYFEKEGFGIDKIREYRRAKPDMDIVVTTKYPVKPELVTEIIALEVGFFKKHTIDPTWLEAEISQRVNIKLSKDRALRRQIEGLQKVAESGGEGVFRLFGLGSAKRRKKFIVDLVEHTNEKVILPKCERFRTVHIGQTFEISEEYKFECSQGIKASTRMGVGLGLEESTKFFSTKVGLEIKQRLQTEFHIEESRTLQGSLRVGQKLGLTAEDEKRQTRRREYYRGIQHDVYRASLRSICEHCGASDPIILRVYVPSSVVEVSVAYDKSGMRVAGEDGREGYTELSP